MVQSSLVSRPTTGKTSQQSKMMKTLLSSPVFVLLLLIQSVQGFVLVPTTTTRSRPPQVQERGNGRLLLRTPTSNKLPSCQHAMMIDPNSAMEQLSSVSSLLLSETQPWVVPTASFLDPFLNFMSFAMLTRVVLSWYPNTSIKDFPWLLVVLPTEPLLRAVRGVIPPAFGVDITPIAWLGLFTFVHEILLGQQGLLTMKIKYGI